MRHSRSDEHVVEVTLSRRNLLTLLAKVDNPRSAKTLTANSGGKFLIVRAEDDATHYAERPPGLVAFDAAQTCLVARDLVKQVSESLSLDDRQMLRIAYAVSSCDLLAEDLKHIGNVHVR